MTYDLVIIGAGPAGYLAALRAARNGINTLLIEKQFIGGVCLNQGCIPSKVFLNSAKIFNHAKNGDKYGITAANIKLDHKVVIQRKNSVVKTLVAGIDSQLKKNKITIIKGVAEITGKNSEGYTIKSGSNTYTGKRLLIATGSIPIMPGLKGAKQGFKKGYVLTNSEIFDIEKIPSSLVVIGAGVTGLELGSYFNSLGSKVTFIEILPYIAGNIDREISEILQKSCEQNGVKFKLNSKAVEIKDGSVTYQTNGQKLTLKAEKILMSIGRSPVINDLGLEKIGVEIQEGRIKVDEYGKTNIPNVYAAGDVNGTSMLAHTAYREAEVCINNMLGKKDVMRYGAIPSVIYTNPEVAGAGETEESARKKGLDYEVQNISMRYSGRYEAENEDGTGICKVLIDKKYGRIIGVHMIGNSSSEIIYGASLMIETEMRVADIKELVFPHPTVSEIIREAIFKF